MVRAAGASPGSGTSRCSSPGTVAPTTSGPTRRSVAEVASGEEVPERRRAQRAHRLADVDIAPAVALAGEGQDRSGPAMHHRRRRGSGAPREREPGIGRVKIRLDQRPGREPPDPGTRPKRDDPPGTSTPAAAAKRSGPEPTAVHQPSGRISRRSSSRVDRRGPWAMAVT